ncbi:pilus assembly protein [Sulfitobacter sp. S223]|uniref:TadE/TadG family type IV pilus assembly protein n=1 Tax=Sulfitobacter sp. S223 TaxID=2867023 RepID=UPI0021A2A3DF|nr:TadE family protein [Sulfitobacter sp. S223]UWR25885.1 pilus assembly protein [Sulfitobacter sp. S223]
MITSSRFIREESGAALVEFALIFPVMMLMLGVAIEGSRTYHSYQTAVSGVRDAARYLSRVVQSDVCTSGAGVAQWDETLTDMVQLDRAQKSVFSSDVDILNVSSTLECVSGDWRGKATAPVATITATLKITYPFSGMFSFGGGSLPAVTTTISDSARIIGS